MNTLSPTIEFQQIIHKQLYDALQGDLLLDINAICDSNGSMIIRDKSINEGERLRILPNTLPELYATCMEVVSTLEYAYPIDFYVAGEPMVNAYSVVSYHEDIPDRIVLTSGLVKLFTIDELKFAIGHEVGHLINGDNMLNALERFVYPERDNEPDYIVIRTRLYNHLAELGADRWGYIACKNIDAAITACYKLASELDLNAMNVSVQGLIDEAYIRVKDFFEGKLNIYGEHPAIPMRVIALHQFATAKTEEELEETLYDIIRCSYAPTEEDILFGQFAAAAGVLLAPEDGTENPLEKAFILEKIGEGNLFPECVLEEVEKAGDIAEYFQQITQEFAEKCPESKSRMMEFFVDLALIDKGLTRDEVDFIFSFARSINIPDPITADFLGEKIRARFVLQTL